MSFFTLFPKLKHTGLVKFLTDIKKCGFKGGNFLQVVVVKLKDPSNSLKIKDLCKLLDLINGTDSVVF